MRRILTLMALFSFFATQLCAQTGNEVSVSVTIAPPYSPYFSEYSDLLDQGIITITNLTGSPQTLKLVGYVQGDNGLEAFTNANYQPFNPILLNPFETRVILASQQNQEYLDANNISYNASQSVINQILQTGILPEGNYQICIRALDFNNNQPLSPDAPMGCVFFPVIYVQPPFLTYPMCEDSVTTTNNMMVLNWLPVSAATPLPVVYDLYIVQLMAGQNPNDAMMGAINFGAGNPIIKLGLVTNSAITLPSDLPLQFGQWYAWAVVARDPSNTVVIENNGRSEVCTFYVKEQEPIAGTGIPPVYTPVNTGFNQQYQGLPIATITGQLDYRFHGDQYTGVNLSSLQSPVIQNVTQGIFGNLSGDNGSNQNTELNSIPTGNSGSLMIPVCNSSTEGQNHRLIYCPNFTTQAEVSH